MFERIISPTVFPGGSMGRFPQPASMRSFACAVLRPSAGLASNTATSRLKGSSGSFFFLSSSISVILAQGGPK